MNPERYSQVVLTFSINYYINLYPQLDTIIPVSHCNLVHYFQECVHYLTAVQLANLRNNLEQQLCQNILMGTNYSNTQYWCILLFHGANGHPVLERAAAETGISLSKIVRKLPNFLLFTVERTRIFATFQRGTEPVVISDIRRPIRWQPNLSEFTDYRNQSSTSVSDTFEARIEETRDPELLRHYLSFPNVSISSGFLDRLAAPAVPPPPPRPTAVNMRNGADVLILQQGFEHEFVVDETGRLN